VARLTDVASAEVVIIAREPRTDASAVIDAVARSLDEEFGEQL
jgi:hypothetical protein